MRRRCARRGRWLLWLVVLAGCGDDAITDEDRIERFIEDVSGPVDEAYVARTLDYVALSKVPLDVRVPHHAGVYGEGKAGQLAKRYEAGLRRHFFGSEIKVRGSRYELAGDRASVELGLLTAVGRLRAELALTKTALGEWKLSKVHVHR